MTTPRGRPSLEWKQIGRKGKQKRVDTFISKIEKLGEEVGSKFF